MTKQELTPDLLEKLTPREGAARFGLTERELKVLRMRFGVTKKSQDDYSEPEPPKGGGDDGTGGAPAPAIQ